MTRVSRSPSGYVLIEMLVSTAIASALLGVLLQFAVAAQGTVRAQADVADVQQRLRVAIESLRRDLLIAGAGPSRGEGRGPLMNVFAPILPARTGVSGADPELSYYADRISITYVANAGAQTALRARMASTGRAAAHRRSGTGLFSGRRLRFLTRGSRADLRARQRRGSARDIHRGGCGRAMAVERVPLVPRLCVREPGRRD